MPQQHNPKMPLPSHEEELAIVKGEDYDAELRRGNITPAKKTTDEPNDSLVKHRL